MEQDQDDLSLHEFQTLHEVAMLGRVISNPRVAGAIARARAAQVPWPQIVAAILKALADGNFNISTIIQIILDLIPKTPPA